MQNRLVRTKYCMPVVGSRIRDIESKYYVALRFSIHRDLGTIIAANPSTILAMARLGDREKQTLIRDLADGTIHPRWQIARRHPCRTPQQDPQAPPRSLLKNWNASSTRPAGFSRKTTGQTCSSCPTGWAGPCGPTCDGYPEFFGDKPVRDVGLIASEGRMTIPIDDGTPAGLLDIRHHYFEFIPEEQAEFAEPDTLEADRAGRRPELLHRAHDGRGPLPVQYS